MSRRRPIEAVRGRLRAAAADGEAGFTVFEVLIASIMLIAGALATFQIFDSSVRNTYRAEQSQVANDIAQQELEKLRFLDYRQVALTAYPGSSSDPGHPNHRVLGTDFALSPNGSNPAPMVVQGSPLDSGGQVSCDLPGTTPVETCLPPGPTEFTNGDVSGDIYRYVVWGNDPSCSTCGGNQDFKRIVVAVTLDDVPLSSDRSYVEVQSDVVNPADTSLTEQNLPDGDTLTAEQFFLTDTPCAASGSTTRLPINFDHLLHNTLGTCENGVQFGATPGAPDALLDTVPPDAFPDDPLLPDSFDYADDPYLEPTPDFDDGLQMLRQDADGCAYTPGGANPQAKIHRWVSDPMASSYVMNGHATLELNTKTINAAVQSGRICVYLFVRTTNGDGSVTDTRILDNGTGNPYWTFQPPGNWAAGSWGLYRISLDFPQTTVAVANRVGLAISIERAGSPGDLQFLYDHPQFDSRLEVDTPTPLGG